MSLSKEMHDGFAKFFEAPSRDTLRDLLKYGSGEADRFDFKEEWPDKPKIAKHVLALANFGGGALIIGVNDSLDLVSSGLPPGKKVDKTDISKQISSYLPPSLKYDIFDFDYPSDSEYSKIRNKSFQVLLVVSSSEDLPYLCIKAGDGIKANVVYTRARKESAEADHHQVQEIFERRLASRANIVENARFQNDLDQLRILYKEMEKFSQDQYSQLFRVASFLGSTRKSKHFPAESHDSFIATLIARKKSKLTDSI